MHVVGLDKTSCRPAPPDKVKTVEHEYSEYPMPSYFTYSEQLGDTASTAVDWRSTAEIRVSKIQRKTESGSTVEPTYCLRECVYTEHASYTGACAGSLRFAGTNHQSASDILVP